MKPRPRSIERKVAAYLSERFLQLGLSPVERIPVLGRTGPDISLNELNIVIDVKSRLEVPVSVFCPRNEFRYICNGLISVPLCNFLDIFENNLVCRQDYVFSKIVQDYYDHIDEWTRTNIPSGITALVLHRPKKPIGNSILVISNLNRRRLQEWYKTHKQL